MSSAVDSSSSSSEVPAVNNTVVPASEVQAKKQLLSHIAGLTFRTGWANSQLRKCKYFDTIRKDAVVAAAAFLQSFIGELLNPIINLAQLSNKSNTKRTESTRTAYIRSQHILYAIAQDDDFLHIFPDIGLQGAGVFLTFVATPLTEEEKRDRRNRRAAAKRKRQQELDDVSDTKKKNKKPEENKKSSSLKKSKTKKGKKIAASSTKEASSKGLKKQKKPSSNKDKVSKDDKKKSKKGSSTSSKKAKSGKSGSK